MSKIARRSPSKTARVRESAAAKLGVFVSSSSSWDLSTGRSSTGCRSRTRSTAGPRIAICQFPHSSRATAGWIGRRERRDHEDIRAPMPVAIDRALAFIDRNTRHPMRILRMERLRLTEYPVDGLREALVNAVSHRQYDDAGRKIILELFADRVCVLSPGLPPKPITLAGLRSGRYRPCSRNPVLAQCLSYFHRIEERGGGFRRMRDLMLDHGLDPPVLSTDTGYFQVTFMGPGDNVERLRVPDSRIRVTPSVEAQLNERQKRMVQWLVEGRELTSRDCQAEFGVTRPVTASDLQKLVQLGLAEQVGRGRATRYRYRELGES